MAEGIAAELAGQLLGYLGKVAVQKLAPYFGGRDKVEQLRGPMRMIQATFVDAERKEQGEYEQGSAVVKERLRRLKGVLYKLEDLFEDVSFADQEHKRQRRAGGMLSRPVRILILEARRLKMNNRVSKQVKAILRDLDGIKFERETIELSDDKLPIQVNTLSGSERPTHSLVQEEDVIGREEVRKIIVDLLLKSHQDKTLSVISIVGMGGLGKTALAQLCYNDGSVKQHFELRGWACISDPSSTLLEMAQKISESMCDGSRRESSLERIKSNLQAGIKNKRFLLVLDDVWSEDRQNWLDLKPLLSGGDQGSKILVTTRSKQVAEIMDAVEHPLEGLSADKSRILFQKLAFKENSLEPDSSLISIGDDIVKKCVNVPLAIRTIASLLYSKHTVEEWIYFRDNELTMIDRTERGIMSTLKLSYSHLPSQLKQCFAYCSLFPKDSELDKQQLILLWMAQGFLSSENRTPEDVGHAYFMELCNRCFFQDVERNEFGRIVGCKMHDLFHDLACQVGDECLLVDGQLQNTAAKIDNARHMSFVVKKSDLSSMMNAPSWMSAAQHKRSFLLRGDPSNCCTPNINAILCLKRLRALQLMNSELSEELMHSIGKFKQLKYLAVRGLKSFPIGIERLQNLQTLILYEGFDLGELPRGFSKLSDLRHLLIRATLPYYVDGETTEPSLIDMPPRFGELTSIQTLDTFIVGVNNGLDALGRLNLTGELQIWFRQYRQNAVQEAANANLNSKKKLTSLELNWSLLGDKEATHDTDKELEYLQPPTSLEELVIKDWKGVRFPKQWTEDFRRLASVEIVRCSRCVCLPSLSQLPLLKSLELVGLHALEYIEYSYGSSEATFFPRLENLKLEDLPELKGWSSHVNHDQHFPRLSELEINKCLKMMSMPQPPRLESMRVRDIPVSLLNQIWMTQKKGAAMIASSSSTRASNLKNLFIKLNVGVCSFSIEFWSRGGTLDIDLCREGMSMKARYPMGSLGCDICGCPHVSGPMQQMVAIIDDQQLEKACEEFDFGDVSRCPTLFHASEVTFEGIKTLSESIDNLIQLQNLKIYNSGELTSLPRSVGDLTQLQNLKIWSCDKLTSLPRSVGDLTQLQTLEILSCHKLTALPDSFGGLIQLQNLQICGCHELMSLPRSVGDLTQLQTLEISDCHKLTALPDSFGGLIQLQNLQIRGCHELMSLPRSVGDLTQLQTLEISFCQKVTALPDSFGSLTQLQKLKIDNNLELINSSSIGNLISCLTQLKTLEIDCLHKWRSLPESIAHLGQLRKLVIWKGGCLEPFGHLLRCLTMLEDLEFREFNKLTSLTDSINPFPNLHRLLFSGCDGLSSLLGSLSNLPQLTHLTIEWCDNLESLGDVSNLAMLEELSIKYLPKLRSLPKSLGYIPRLGHLYIFQCPKLRSLPDSLCHLTPLQSLRIRGCPHLTARYGRQGQHRHLIQHIRNISISD